MNAAIRTVEKALEGVKPHKRPMALLKLARKPENVVPIRRRERA